MTAPTLGSPAEENALLLSRAVEISVRLATLAILAAWCFVIFRPFVLPILWAIVIGVALYPVYSKLRSILGGSDKLAATVFVLAGLALVVIPTIRFAGSTIGSIQTVTEQVQTGTFSIPAPTERVQTWPLVGERVYTLWSQAATDLESTLASMAPQLRQVGAKALDLLRGLGSGVIQTIIAIIIAGFMLANTEGSRKASVSVFTRLAGARGERCRIDLRGCPWRWPLGHGNPRPGSDSTPAPDRVGPNHLLCLCTQRQHRSSDHLCGVERYRQHQ